MNVEMTYDRARDILSSIKLKKERWGRLYDVGKDNDYKPEEILQALVTLLDGSAEAGSDVAEDLLKAKRQLNAAKARETKLKKEKDALTAKLEESNDKLAQALGRITYLEEKGNGESK